MGEVNDHTNQSKSTIESILMEYDVVYNSYISLSFSDFLKSKRDFLISINKLIADTADQVIELKNNLGINHASYIEIVNEIYVRVYQSIVIAYNKEVSLLNISSKSIRVAPKMYFNAYINLLKIALSNLSGIETWVKLKIESSLQTIIDNDSELEDYNNQLNERNSIGVFLDFINPSENTVGLKLEKIIDPDLVKSSIKPTETKIEQPCETGSQELAQDNDESIKSNVEKEQVSSSINFSYSPNEETNYPKLFVKVEDLLYKYLENQKIDESTFQTHYDVIYNMKKNKDFDEEVLKKIYIEIKSV